MVEDLYQARFRTDESFLSIRVAGTPNILTREHFALADRLGLGVSIDAVAGPDSTAWILSAEARGWLGPNRTLIHCTQISDDAWAAIARTGSTVSLCPDADTQYAVGRPPLAQALEAGVRPSISVDDDLGLSSDMWTQMRILSATYRQAFGIFSDGNSADLERARDVQAYDLLDFATRQGAKANGLEGRTGAILAGNEADLVLLEADDLNTMPLNNAYGSVVWGADTSNVHTVVVGGIIRKHGGRLVGLDLAALRERVRRSRDRLLGRAGRSLTIVERTN